MDNKKMSLNLRGASDIDFSLAQKCWPIHEAIIELIRPKLKLTFGNSSISPYAYLHTRLGGKEDSFPSGHGNWSIKSFSCKINGHPLFVVGLPHLSRYLPIGKKQVVQWLLEKYNNLIHSNSTTNLELDLH